MQNRFIQDKTRNFFKHRIRIFIYSSFDSLFEKIIGSWINFKEKTLTHFKHALLILADFDLMYFKLDHLSEDKQN